MSRTAAGFGFRWFCLANVVESLHLSKHSPVICRVTENWIRDTVNKRYMTTWCNPSFLNDRITKNCTSCKIQHHPLSELLIRARLDKFPGRWVGRRGWQQNAFAKSRSLMVVTFFCGVGKAGSVQIKSTNVSWTVTPHSMYLCCRSSWFFKEKLLALSRL